VLSYVPRATRSIAPTSARGGSPTMRCAASGTCCADSTTRRRISTPPGICLAGLGAAALPRRRDDPQRPPTWTTSSSGTARAVALIDFRPLAAPGLADLGPGPVRLASGYRCVHRRTPSIAGGTASWSGCASWSTPTGWTRRAGSGSPRPRSATTTGCTASSRTAPGGGISGFAAYWTSTTMERAGRARIWLTEHAEAITRAPGLTGDEGHATRCATTGGCW